MNSYNITLKRYSLIYNPPTFIVYFLNEITGKMKRRSMKLNQNSLLVDNKTLAKEIVDNNSDIFIRNTYSLSQIESFLDKLKNAMNKTFINYFLNLKKNLTFFINIL